MEQKSSSKQSVVVRFRRFSGKSFSAFRSMHRVINIGVLAGITLTTLATHEAEAQQRKPHHVSKQDNDETELQEVTVTASKVATPLNQVARQVTVISQREILSAPIRSLQDLLVYSAGVDVQQRGGHGVQADISIRGGSFDQNAILLNGVNLSNAQTGHLSYDIPVNLSDIERIEVIHGASGIIYGSSAFSGGINIITKKEAHEKLYAQIVYGPHKTYMVEGRTSFASGKTSNSISISHKGSDGYVNNTDYKILNILAQSNINLDSLSKIQVQLGLNTKDYGANTFYASPRGPQQHDKTDNAMASVRGEFTSGNFHLTPIIYWNRTHDEYMWDRTKPELLHNFHKTDNYGANLALAYTSSLGITSLGVELRQENIRSNRLGEESSSSSSLYNKSASRLNTSVSLEHSVILGKLSASAGLMANHNTQRSGKYEFLPSLSLTYRPDTHWSLSASYSQGVRIPTYIDLYYKSRNQDGNKDLAAEHSRSLETSVKYRSRALALYATGFALWGSNIIDWAKTSATDAKYKSMNIGTLNTYGVEAGLKVKLGQLLPALGEYTSLQVDYTHMKQIHDSDGLISMYALRYLRDKLTAKLDFNPWEKLYASCSLRYQKRMGEYESGQDATTKAILYSPYPAYLTLDARVDYELTKQIELSLMLNNITDTKYFDFAALHQPGFQTHFGLTYRLGR